METGSESRFQARLTRALQRDKCIVHKIPGGMFLKDEPDLRVCSTRYDTIRFVELKAYQSLPPNKDPIPPTLTREQHGRLLLLSPSGCHNFSGLVATEYLHPDGHAYVVHVMHPDHLAMCKGQSLFCKKSDGDRFSRAFPTLCLDTGEVWFSYNDDNAGQVLLENAWVFQLPWWRGLILPEYHHYKEGWR